MADRLGQGRRFDHDLLHRCPPNDVCIDVVTASIGSDGLAILTRCHHGPASEFQLSAEPYPMNLPLFQARRGIGGIVAIPRSLFTNILRVIDGLRPPPLPS